MRFSAVKLAEPDDEQALDQLPPNGQPCSSNLPASKVGLGVACNVSLQVAADR
jgi:hypothetical protein